MGFCLSKHKIEEEEVKKPMQKMVAAPAPKKKKGPTAEEKNRLTELRAAILIQKWVRIWLSKFQARRELAWCVFQKVEYLGERNQMRLNNFFRVLIQEFAKDIPAEKKVQTKGSSSDDGDKLLVIPSDVGVDISPPFSAKNLNLLMNYLKTGKNLHYTCVINLLLMTAEKLKNKNNFNEVSTSVTKKVTIVGDLHGHLDDLLTIFYKNDIPSVSNPYIFNGDMVDKGSMSVEVAAVLCYCVLLFPNHVHLNRGNHEDPDLNENHGLVKELMTKYRHTNKKILKLLKNFYQNIPLATIIDRKVFVVHGGISDKTDLQILKNVQRRQYDSIMKPPRLVVEGRNSEWQQLIDILWSDPSSENGCSANSSRGGGKCFGPDVTEKFMETNKFELIIRSHECKPDGYGYDHSGNILTVFSSSNYYHPGSNKAAYIVYMGNKKKINHIQFLSSDESLKNIKFTANVLSMEGKAITELKRMLHMYRYPILKKFQEYDKKKTGKITMEEYIEVLGDTLGLTIPWRLVQPKITEKDENNLIIYESTFELMKHLEEQSASDILYSNLDVLETIFRAIDKDSSGLITMDEFNDAISVLNKHSDLDIGLDLEGLGEIIDSDKDGFIDIDEFFDAFKISKG